MTIHSSTQTVFGLSHIKGITQGAGKEVDEVAVEVNGMGVDRIGEVGDMTTEGQAAGVYEAGFTAGSQASEGARDRGWF